jgi:hypothetical protein
MARSLVALLVALAGLAAGCGQAAVAEPELPSRTADHQTQPRRLERERVRPRLLAPPPAYGNKVVMAKASGVVAEN